MPVDQAHWRIVYPDGQVYHVLGSSNILNYAATVVKLNEHVCKRFKKTATGIKRFFFWQRIHEITPLNGLASIWEDEENDLSFKHVYVEGGNALDAMNKMVELLDKKHAPWKHMCPIVKF